MDPTLVALAVAAAPLALVGLFRLARALDVLPTRAGACEGCGRHDVPVVGVLYGKNTGLLVARMTSSLEATLCRRCSLVQGGKMTLHTALLGWWGTLSFFLTAAMVPWNLLQLLWAAGLPSADAAAHKRLVAHRAWAEALVATKDRATVVQVLGKETGASPAAVERFLANLAPHPAAFRSGAAKF